MSKIERLKIQLRDTRAKLFLARKERRETVTDLVSRLIKARKCMARVRKFHHELPSCF